MILLRSLGMIYFSLGVIFSNNLSAMDGPNPAKAAPLSKFTIHVVINGLTNKKISLEERIGSYNPTTILTGLKSELAQLERSSPGFEQSLKNIVLTAVFAITFHGVLTHETIGARETFREFLSQLMTKAKASVLSAPQRRALTELSKKQHKRVSNLFELFFLGQYKQYIDPMNHAIAGIEVEIKGRFKMPSAQQPVFLDALLDTKSSVLDFALLFNSENAVITCCKLADGFKASGDINRAKIYYQKAAQFDLNAIYNIGCIFHAEKNIDEAYKYLKAASDKGHPQAAANLGMLLLVEREDSIAAQPYLEQGANLGDLATMTALGLLLYEQGKWEQALMWYKRAAQKKHVNAMYGAALVLAKMGNHPESRKWMEAAADANYPLAQYHLGALHYEENNLLLAKKYLGSAAAAHNHEAQNNLGTIFIAENDLDSAQECFAQAANAGFEIAQVNLAIILFLKGEKERALEHILALAQKGLPEACDVFATFLEQEGDLINAASYYQKAAASLPHAVLSLARLFEKRGLIDEAARLYEEAIQLGVKDAGICYSHFLWQLGRYDEAIIYYNHHKEDCNIYDNKSSEEEVIAQEAVKQRVPVALEPAVNPALPAPKLDPKVESPTGISKRLQKFYKQAEKRRQEASPLKGQPVQEEKWRSYKDVKIFASSKVECDLIGENQTRIQSLLSALANKEMRGRFKSLKGHKNLYAMRITQGDRLVFEILEGDIMNGIKAIKIISATGHYKHLDIKAESQTEVRQFRWPKK